MKLTKTGRRRRIKNRIRKVVKGTAQRPRLSVFRSNKEIYAQLIDDDAKTTLGASSSKAAKGSKSDQAAEAGKAIAEVAKGAGISTVVFDRGGYLFHGRVKSLADAAREAGLKF